MKLGESIKAHADRFFGLVEENLSHVGERENMKIRSAANTGKVRLGGRATATPTNGQLGNGETRLVGCICIQKSRVPKKGGRLEEGLGEFAVPGGTLHRQWAPLSMIPIEGDIQVTIIFSFEKVGKHLFVRPTVSAATGPGVVVLAIACKGAELIKESTKEQMLTANVDHRVERRGASENFASWPI